MELLLYWNTLRFLKFSQIWGRALHRFYKPCPRATAAPPRRNGAGLWRTPCTKSPRFVPPDRFVFLNEPRTVRTAGDWNAVLASDLWLYNLHYFDDLRRPDHVALEDDHCTLVDRWIRENPPTRGIGWHSYPISLRLVNWIIWWLNGASLREEWCDSAAVQLRWLAKRMERHLLGNHLFANAKALVFGGVFFDGPEADGWLALGLRCLDREIPEQILPDGSHFERSPMYHALILEDILDLVNLNIQFPIKPLVERREQWLRVASRMLKWLSGVLHPDGGIPFFNDAAFGVATDFEHLSAYASRLGVQDADPPINSPVGAGYFRINGGPFTVIFDAAPIGPDYLPGHAHADTLSFELSWNKQRIICNTGCSRYGTSERRLFERSTAAHATVSIDGQNSSEVWSGFRVGRRAYPSGVTKTESGVKCSHDGYTRLRGAPVHEREITIVSNEEVVWRDRVSGGGNHLIAGAIPLHPDISVQRESAGILSLILPCGSRLLLERENDGVLDIREGVWCPEFGLERSRKVITWEFGGQLPFETTLRLHV